VGKVRVKDHCGFWLLSHFWLRGKREALPSLVQGSGCCSYTDKHGWHQSQKGVMHNWLYTKRIRSSHCWSWRWPWALTVDRFRPKKDPRDSHDPLQR